MNESHIQHSVGFVKHKYFDLAQINEPLAYQIEEPPRGGCEDMDAVADFADLVELFDTAEDDGVAETCVFAIDTETFVDLAGQFTRGREDQGPRLDRTSAALVWTRYLQPMEDWECKSCSLARPRLGAAQDIASLHGGRDCLGLDGRGGVIALLFDGIEQGFAEIE